MPRLTLKTVKALPVTGKDAVHWDSEKKGFGLRITASGAKSYFIKYRNAQGRSRYLTIGKSSDWTPEQARERAGELLRKVDTGLDPAENKIEARAAITISQLCDEYVEAARKGLVVSRGKAKKASTLRQDESRISAHIKPLLGDVPVKSLTQVQVRQFYANVTTGKTAGMTTTGKKRGKSIVEGGPTAAKRCVGLLGGMMTYAIGKGYRPEGVNPASKINMMADKTREFRLDGDGWRALGESIEAAEAKNESWQAVAIARLLALTGCRKEEIGSLRWDEIDFQGRCFLFGKAADGQRRVKTGEIRPLGQAALSLLSELKASPRPGKGQSDYVFPGALTNEDKPYQGLKGAFKRMGIAYSPHNFRHAVASVAAVDCELSESTVGAILGHGKRGVTSKYIHKPDAVLLAAADKVSDFVARAMKGRE